MLRLTRLRISRLYNSYDGLLQTHRLPTTTATGLVLAFAGDLCTQSATSAGGLDDYDLHRGCSFALFGGAVTGPVNYMWLTKLDTWVKRAAPAGGWRAIACKLAVQTFFFQPCVYVPLFFTFSAAFRGWSMEVAVERVRSEYTRTLQSLWGFWTPICIFTFAVLPVRQQAIFFSAVSLGWNAILSFLSNQTLEQAPAAPVESAKAGVTTKSSRQRLRQTPSGRYLPDHQPPMSIIDNDGQPPRRQGPTDQSVVGYLLGPGLM